MPLPRTDVLNDLLKVTSSSPDIVTLSEALMGRFQGVEGLAAEIYDEIDKTKKGTPGRARLLCAVIDLLKVVTLKVGHKDPLDGTSVESLASGVKEVFRNVDAGRSLSNVGRDSFANPRS